MWLIAVGRRYGHMQSVAREGLMRCIDLMQGRGLRRFFLGTWNMKGFLSEERPIRTLREVLQRLRESYCGQIGYEVNINRHSSAHPLYTLSLICSLSDVSWVQPFCCHWVCTGAGPQSSIVRVQYMHIPDRERCNWLRERIETPEEVRAFHIPPAPSAASLAQPGAWPTAVPGQGRMCESCLTQKRRRRAVCACPA